MVRIMEESEKVPRIGDAEVIQRAVGLVYDVG